MSEMVETVADAIKSKLMEARFRDDEVTYEEIAQAAIEAMRSPGDDFASYLQLAHDLRPQDWSELIDAALTDPSSPSPGTSE